MAKAKAAKIKAPQNERMSDEQPVPAASTVSVQMQQGTVSDDRLGNQPLTFNRRTERRVPLNRPVQIRRQTDVASQHPLGEISENAMDADITYNGFCKELAVTSLTVHSDLIPQHNEVLEITITPPSIGAICAPPMVIQAQVRRCCKRTDMSADVNKNSADTLRYEIGLSIVKVLS